MTIEFHPAAFRHGISRDRSRYVITHCRHPAFQPDPEDPDQGNLTLFLGLDQRGVPLEVAGLELEGDRVLVIHAMKCRDAYLDDLAEMMR